MLMLPDFLVRQRDFLLEISRAITAQLDLSEVLRRALNASVVMLAGQVGLVALRAPDDQFYVRAVSGIASERIPALNRQLHELVQLLSDSETVMQSEAFSAKLEEMAQDIDAQLQQSIALPLAFAGEPLGLMIVFRSYMGSATANDLKILHSFADQAAIAVHNAQLYERINQERKRLAAILEHSGDGVMILSRDLCILQMNRALERMTGWYAKDAIGLDVSDVIVWQQVDQGDLHAALDDGWPLVSFEKSPEDATLYVEGDIERRDGLALSIGITYAPLMGADGDLTTIIANVRDITNFRKAQEMQSTFISVISHELKTPVAIIKGYAATLQRTDATWEPEIIRENLGVIEDEADRLDALIQNLLTASKLQTERVMSLELGEVWLDEVAARAVERAQNQSAEHTLTLSFPSDFPPVGADEMRLRQVIDNLLSNAIKYSPTGGEIKVGGRFNADYVTVYVKDHGVGLSDEQRDRVFERFYRVEGALSRKTQGTGLGLYLSRAIVEAHGGTIGVESRLGQGSTFYFTIPR